MGLLERVHHQGVGVHDAGHHRGEDEQPERPDGGQEGAPVEETDDDLGAGPQPQPEGEDQEQQLVETVLEEPSRLSVAHFRALRIELRQPGEQQGGGRLHHRRERLPQGAGDVVIARRRQAGPASHHHAVDGILEQRDGCGDEEGPREAPVAAEALRGGAARADAVPGGEDGRRPRQAHQPIDGKGGGHPGDMGRPGQHSQRGGQPRHPGHEQDQRIGDHPLASQEYLQIDVGVAGGDLSAEHAEEDLDERAPGTESRHRPGHGETEQEHEIETEPDGEHGPETAARVLTFRESLEMRLGEARQQRRHEEADEAGAEADRAHRFGTQGPRDEDGDDHAQCAAEPGRAEEKQ
jgi:hypothetical protein